ncbi:MAG: M48 family metalloprotease [Candidatus Rokuibacteriota bacterium]
MERQKLTGLRPQIYEHPSDQQALDALQGTTGLDSLVRACNEYGLERLLRVQYTGSYLRVNGDNFPDIHGQVLAAAEILDLPKIPEIYIQPGEINAMTAGVEHPILVLSTTAVDALTPAELDFVIAHELGHIKSGHVLYYQIATFLPVIGDVIGQATFGIGALLSAGLQIALLKWQRMSELTADRAGLLGGQDVSAAISAMMKLAGLPQRFYSAINTEDFIAQARQFEALDDTWLDWAAKLVSGMGQTHPWTVMRAHELLQWIDGGEYERVRTMCHEEPVAGPGVGAARFCTQCGSALTGAELFCPRCGGKQRVTPVSP